MNISYKEDEILYEDKSRLYENSSNLVIDQDADQVDGSELIEEYNKFAMYYNNKNFEEIHSSLYQIQFLLRKVPDESVPPQSKEAFTNLKISNILIDIVFNETDFPNNIITNSWDLINYFLTKDDFFKESFAKSGILEYLIKGIDANSSDIDHTLRCLRIMVSMLWKSPEILSSFFDQYHIQISQFIGSFFDYSEKNSYDKKDKDLQKYSTNLIYTLSSSITSEEEAMFIYTYIDSAITKHESNKKFHCNPVLILNTIYNITGFKQALDSIYGNDLIFNMMNEAFFSRDIQKIRPAINIVHILIENGYNISDKCSLYNFFQLIDQDESQEGNEIVERAAEFIHHSLKVNPFNKELEMIINIAGYFLPAYERGNFTMKIQLIKTLCLTIRNVKPDILKEWVKRNLIQILVPALDYDDEEVIIDIIQCLIIIFELDPVYDDKENNIAILDFDQCNGRTKMEDLDHSNEKIADLSAQFLQVFQKVDKENEEIDRT